MRICRGNCGISVLAVALTLALWGPVWAQTAKPTSPDHAILYRRAVGFLDQAQQKFNAGDIATAKTLVKQSNSLFTLLHQEYASLLAGRQLTPKEDQQLAINQKLATDAQAQAERLMKTAATKEKRGRELEAQGQIEASKASYRESRAEYMQAQNFSINSEIYALRNQQMLFRFLGP